MDIVNDIFLWGVQSLLFAALCTILESSIFDLKAKQLFGIFLVYSIMFSAIFNLLILIGYYSDDINKFISDTNISLVVFILACFLIVILLVIAARAILRKIRGAE